MGDAYWLYENSLEVEDACSCVEDPDPENSRKNAQEVEQPPPTPRIEIILKPEPNIIFQSDAKIIPPEARELIGRIVCKHCGGVTYLGTVVDYNIHRKWFRIEYDDEGSEDLVEEEVRKLLASASQIEEQCRQLGGDDGKQKHIPAVEGPAPKRKRKRMDKSGIEALASKTTKRDDSYYY